MEVMRIFLLKFWGIVLGQLGRLKLCDKRRILDKTVHFCKKGLTHQLTVLPMTSF